MHAWFLYGPSKRAGDTAGGAQLSPSIRRVPEPRALARHPPLNPTPAPRTPPLPRAPPLLLASPQQVAAAGITHKRFDIAAVE